MPLTGTHGHAGRVFRTDQGMTAMKAHADHLLQRLGTGKLIGIDHGEGSRVSCVEGALWITQSNDPRDIVIKGGESFVLDRPGLALVCAAAGPAVVAVEVPQPQPPALPPYHWDMRNAAHEPVAAGL
jgi:Protein of unknown function (DUF2917)